MNFSELTGQTIATIDGAKPGSEAITLTLTDGRRFRMYHEQDCCESVAVEDVCGDVDDLIGTPLRMAAETTNGGEVADGDLLWTFYHLGTVKGSVTIRWCGTSSGYYSVSVSFGEVGGP